MHACWYVCVYKRACASLNLGLWGRGLQVSNSFAIFRGHISSAVQEAECVRRKVPPFLSPVPNPRTLSIPNLCPYLKSLLSLLPRPHCSLAVDLPGARSPLASAVCTALAGLGSCSLCYSELLTGAAERGDSLFWAAPGQAMLVSVLLTPTPEMSRPPHDVSSFRKGRRPVISPDVAEVGGEEGVGLPWGSSLSVTWLKEQYMAPAASEPLRGKAHTYWV